MTLHQSMASSTEHQNRREDRGGQVGESWAYLLPQTHQGFNYIYDNSLRMPSRLEEQLFYKDTKEKQHEEGQEGRRHSFYVTHTSSTTIHQQEGYHSPRDPPWQARGSSPTLGSSALIGLAPRNESLIENQWGLMLGELEGYRKPRLHS